MTRTTTTKTKPRPREPRTRPQPRRHPAAVEACCDPHCDRDAGPDPVRCTECGGAICPACADPLGIGPPPLDYCYPCAVRDVARSRQPVDLAPILDEIAARQATVMQSLGLTELTPDDVRRIA